MKTRSSTHYPDLTSVIQNTRRSGFLMGKAPEITARLSELQQGLVLNNTILPGYAPTLEANTSQMEDMHKLYDMTNNLFDPLCFTAGKSKSNTDSVTFTYMSKCKD